MASTSSNALREGFREVLRDPALLLIEVGWRWAFGVVAIVVCATTAFLITSKVRVNPAGLESISGMAPWEMTQAVASVISTLGSRLLRIGPFAVLFLAAAWIVLSALGRRATLLRPALAPAADLQTCFRISTLRAVVTLGALLAWILAGMVAGTVAAVTGNDIPNLGLILLIVIPAILLIVSVWSAANWYISLAPLFAGNRMTQCVKDTWTLVRSQRDEVLEISIATAVIRFVLLVIAFVLSFAVSAVITIPRVVAIDFLAIALLYFLAADFVNIARLVAFAKLRDTCVEPVLPNQYASRPRGAHDSAAVSQLGL